MTSAARTLVNKRSSRSAKQSIGLDWFRVKRKSNALKPHTEKFVLAGEKTSCEGVVLWDRQMFVVESNFIW